MRLHRCKVGRRILDFVQAKGFLAPESEDAAFAPGTEHYGLIPSWRMWFVAPRRDLALLIARACPWTGPQDQATLRDPEAALTAVEQLMLFCFVTAAQEPYAYAVLCGIKQLCINMLQADEVTSAYCKAQGLVHPRQVQLFFSGVVASSDPTAHFGPCLPRLTVPHLVGHPQKSLSEVCRAHAMCDY